LVLRTILPFARWLSGYDFRIPRGSHASRITASAPKRKTVVTGRLRADHASELDDCWRPPDLDQGKGR